MSSGHAVRITHQPSPAGVFGLSDESATWGLDLRGLRACLTVLLRTRSVQPSEGLGKSGLGPFSLRHGRTAPLRPVWGCCVAAMTTDATNSVVAPATALVVGAGPGMGLSIARVFGRAGSSVQLVARDQDGADAMVASLASEGISAVGVAGNVGDPDSLRTALASARDASGDPDVAIYNAGGNLQGAIESIGFDDFISTYALGVGGALVSLQAVLPAMRARGAGTFIATGSGASVRPYATGSAVGAPKAALRNFIEAAALELAPARIRVATVTIHGVLGSGPAFEPAALAEHFWTVWAESALPVDEWQWEHNVRP